MRFISRAGSGLATPQAIPGNEKLAPAAVCDQCRFLIMLNSTTPSEAQVVPFRKKKIRLTATSTSHFCRIEPTDLYETGRSTGRAFYVGARARRAVKSRTKRCLSAGEMLSERPSP